MRGSAPFATLERFVVYCSCDQVIANFTSGGKVEFELATDGIQFGAVGNGPWRPPEVWTLFFTSAKNNKNHKFRSNSTFTKLARSNARSLKLYRYLICWPCMTLWLLIGNKQLSITCI